jgi:hypothetical protein
MLENQETLRQVLRDLGDLLAVRGSRFECVIAGGATLQLLGTITRGTEDVDVFAIRTEDGSLTRAFDGLPDELVRAAADVGPRHGLSPDWLNAVMAKGSRWIPPGFEDRVTWEQFGGLKVGLAGRADLIMFKLEAAADHGSTVSKHIRDLVALQPTDAELDAAGKTLREINAGEPFFQSVQRVRDHVASQRRD